jgi:hypothetical protein
MGGCATKPKTLNSDATAAAAAPEQPKEEAAVVVVTAKGVVVEEIKEVEVTEQENDKVNIVEDDKLVDKKTSLSSLLKEKPDQNDEGVESTQTETETKIQEPENSKEESGTKISESENPEQETETKVSESEIIPILKIESKLPETEIPVEQDSTPASVDAPETESPIEVTEKTILEITAQPAAETGSKETVEEAK